MALQEPIRIAFVGGFGHHYLAPLARESSIRIERPIVFVRAEPNDSCPQRLLDSYGEVHTYDRVDQMLDEHRPNIVSVGGIYGQNGDVIAAALEHGADVVSDKPIASTPGQLDRLRALTRDGRRVLLTEFDMRSRPEFRAAKQAIRSGRIGQPVLSSAQKSYRLGQRPDWYRNRATYAGTMLWVASHAIDAIWFATGQRICAMTGRQGNVSRPEFGSMEDHCTAILELEGGGTGVVHADYSRPDRTPTHGDDRLRVAGRNGVVEVRDGRCLLLAEDGIELDITGSASTQPIHLELLAALRRESQDLYSTQASLEIADVLLKARDAADSQSWLAR